MSHLINSTSTSLRMKRYGGVIMKKPTLGIIIFSLLFSAFSILTPAKTNAEVNVSINIPLPPLVIPAPPALVVIPETYVYYPPDVNVDIFFYRGYWYRPYQGHWFISSRYNGPWRGIEVHRVPRAIIGVPSSFRGAPVFHNRLQYKEVRKNWKGWERDRHWDNARWDKARQERRDYYRGQANRGPQHEQQNWNRDNHDRRENSPREHGGGHMNNREGNPHIIR